MDDIKTLFKLNEGGPLEVSGNYRLVSTEGKIIARQETVYLCRCGESSGKPFCDGTHRRIGFSE